MAAPKGNNGYVDSRKKSALQRFAEKCAFDPCTGCVMWVGGVTSGRGHNEPYGVFWFEGERWFAHRWSALHIHGFEIAGLQVDHNCPHGPSTLCVQHVKPETSEVNRLLQNTRPGRAFQNLDTKRYWAFVTKGMEPYFPPQKDIPNIPLYLPPAWIQPFLPPPILEEFLHVWPH